MERPLAPVPAAPRRLPLLLAGLLLALPACGGGDVAELDVPAMERAIRFGAHWSKGQESWNLGPLWAYHNLCQDPVANCRQDAHEQVEAWLAKPPSGAGFRPLFHPDEPLAGPPPIGPRMQRFVVWGLRAIYCRGTPEPGWLARMAGAESTGYIATHQLMALVLLRERGCLEPVHQPAVRRVAEGIAAEQRGAGFPDLLAETVAMLYWSKNGDLVEPVWLDIILAAQDPDRGSWRDPTDPEWMKPNLHTTTLAAWALAQGLAVHAEDRARLGRNGT